MFAARLPHLSSSSLPAPLADVPAGDACLGCSGSPGNAARVPLRIRGSGGFFYSLTVRIQEPKQQKCLSLNGPSCLPHGLMFLLLCNRLGTPQGARDDGCEPSILQPLLGCSGFEGWPQMAATARDQQTEKRYSNFFCLFARSIQHLRICAPIRSCKYGEPVNFLKL